VRGGPERLIDALRSSAILCRFDLPGQVVPVCALLSKYADVPMSLADACLIRMPELNPAVSPSCGRTVEGTVSAPSADARAPGMVRLA
jgi:hypothetical protein